MRPFGGMTALALTLALGAMVFTQACSDKSKEKAQAPAGAALSQADVDRTVALAREKLDKLRFNLGVSRETRIEVLGGKPGPLPGTVQLRLRVTKEDRSAFRKVVVTPDMELVFLGLVVRLGQVPRMRVDLENVDTKNSPMKGDPNAPVTIVEYSDFQCPYCRISTDIVKEVLREYEGKVKLVYRHYPLRMHPWAGDAAMLSECARMQKPELFWKLHDFYYGNTQRLNRDNILEKTQEQVKGPGFDLDRFNKCYLEQETAPIIKKSLDEGRSIGVKGTPAFLVNDVFLSGNQPFPVLSAVVLEELGHDWSKDPSPKGIEMPQVLRDKADAIRERGRKAAEEAAAKAPMSSEAPEGTEAPEAGTE